MTENKCDSATLPSADAEGIVDVLSLAENLKTEMRHSWLSNGRQESVAEHTWMMSVAAVLMAPHLQHPVDLGQTLKLIALHDIAEAITGDIPYFEESARKDTKLADEAEAMEAMRGMLPAASGRLLIELWREYEDCETPEAKFARALDKLEVQHQHNLADLQTWTEQELGLVYTKMDRECAHDTALMTLLAVIRSKAEKKMRQGGIDPIEIKARAL
ncbi:HD domain-containing protein (plasmid) [Paracoccus sp. Arc7-R13]|uniref:HD domain-containing protein n=1 Tax=Paracoccus sp. Arc7-R13 TaxID=2500532 RepID=UPI000FDBA4AC|nr:HD domain-containing protein [Paracoccus sp. Arc7-R13]AZY95504.1 HD domain-containing protein [Paracoccus sp. Arc7-R13]